MRSQLAVRLMVAPLVFVCVLGMAGRAEAQFHFLNPLFATSPVFRSLGQQYPTTVGGFDVPFYTVSPRGIQAGYIGPNGPYGAPVDPNAANAYPNSAPVGSIGSAAIIAPFGQSGGPSDQADTGKDRVAATGGDSAAARPKPSLYGTRPIPRTSESIDARIEKDNRLFISWTGEPKAVNQIRFALLDKDKKPIKEQVVTSLPTQTRFDITSKTSYYRVTVEYVNGTTTNVTAPL